MFDILQIKNLVTNKSLGMKMFKEEEMTLNNSDLDKSMFIRIKCFIESQFIMRCLIQNQNLLSRWEQSLEVDAKRHIENLLK